MTFPQSENVGSIPSQGTECVFVVYQLGLHLVKLVLGDLQCSHPQCGHGELVHGPVRSQRDRLLCLLFIKVLAEADSLSPRDSTGKTDREAFPACPAPVEICLDC